MATIKVNSAVMREKAAAFETVATSVKNYMDDMRTEVEGLRSYWEGEAASATVAQFQKLANQFDGIFDTIHKYSIFLNDAAEAYDNVEGANAGVQ